MNRLGFEQFMEGLCPVARAIQVYDAQRPLNGAARELQGKSHALMIVRTEAVELGELVRGSIAPNLTDLSHEVGDVVFGLADYMMRRGPGELSRGEFLMLGGWVRLITEVGNQYGVDPVLAGVRVNGDKNPKNNPPWAYQHHHPLDPQRKVIEDNEMVRIGLRRIRNLNSDRKLTGENLDLALQFWGYTREVLGRPELAFQFISQVARGGVRL